MAEEVRTEKQVKITFFTPSVDPGSKVLATLGVYLIPVDLFLSKCRIVKGTDDEIYVVPPSEKYTCPRTGQCKWSKFWFFGEKNAEYFQKECKRSLIEYCESKKIAHPWHPAFVI